MFLGFRTKVVIILNAYEFGTYNYCFLEDCQKKTPNWGDSGQMVETGT